MRRQSMTLAVLSLVLLSFALSAYGPAQVPVQVLAVDVPSAASQRLAKASVPSTQQSGNQLAAQRSNNQMPPSALAAATGIPSAAQTALPSPTVAQRTPVATATLSPVPTKRGDPGTATEAAPSATAVPTTTAVLREKPATATEAAPQMAPVSGSSAEPQEPASATQAAAAPTQLPAQNAQAAALAGSSAMAASESAVPERIVAPSIKLDSKIVPVGWHDVTNPDGSRTSEWDVASYAVSWHKTSALLGRPGNTVLTGHNNEQGEVFRHLEHFKIGDPLTIYSGGRAFKYTVTDRFILQEKGVSYAQRLENGKWIGPFPDERVTLMSCWPYTGNSHRIFIIAKSARAG